MTDRLTDEQVALAARLAYDGAGVVALAREVQEYRALRPDCPTCGGSGERPINHQADKYAEPYHVCPDCTNGKMPLNKWVALLVEDGSRLSGVLSRGTFHDIDDAQARHAAVLKMVPK